jgi:hypothetical protein
MVNHRPKSVRRVHTYDSIYGMYAVIHAYVTTGNCARARALYNSAIVKLER